MEPDREYYQWRVEAEKNGLSHLAATAYYLDDSKRLYGIYVDGDPITAPIFSYRDWVHKSDSEYPIGSISDAEPVSDYNEKVIEEIERVISFRKNNSIESEIGTNLWNGEVYAAEGSHRNNIDLELQKSDYYTVRSAAGILEEELYKRLYERDLEPDASFKEIQDEIPRLYLPYRSEIAESFDDLIEIDSPRLVGSTGITFYQDENGEYHFPVIVPDSSVSEGYSLWTPPEGGVLQVLDHNELSIKNHYYEKLQRMSSDTIGSSGIDLERIKSEIASDDNESEISHTATGIDCKSGSIQIYNAMVLTNPDHYQQISQLTADDIPGVDRFALVNTKNTEALKKLLSINTMNPQNVMGLSEGLQFLETEHFGDIGVFIRRM